MKKELKVALSKFNAAARKMKSMSKEQYIALELCLDIHDEQDERITCSVYRPDVGRGQGETWEEAFKNFDTLRKEKNLD